MVTYWNSLRHKHGKCEIMPHGPVVVKHYSLPYQDVDLFACEQCNWASAVRDPGGNNASYEQWLSRSTKTLFAISTWWRAALPSAWNNVIPTNISVHPDDLVFDPGVAVAAFLSEQCVQLERLVCPLCETAFEGDRISLVTPGRQAPPEPNKAPGGLLVRMSEPWLMEWNRRLGNRPGAGEVIVYEAQLQGGCTYK